MYNCMIDLFFYDHCSEFAVLLNDFATNIIVFMIKKKECRIDTSTKFDEISVRVIEKTLDIVFKLQIKLSEKNTECKFQFCT